MHIKSITALAFIREQYVYETVEVDRVIEPEASMLFHLDTRYKKYGLMIVQDFILN